MSEQEKHKELDHLLDSLLDQYSDVEPTLGLETRLIANLRDASSSKKIGYFWRWLLTGAGAVAVAVAVLVTYVSQTERLPELPAIRVAGIPTLPVTTSATSDFAKHPVHPYRKSSLAKAEDIRQEVFPTPTSPSPGERLLFKYLAQTSKDEVAALSSRDDEEEEGPGLPGSSPRQVRRN